MKVVRSSALRTGCTWYSFMLDSESTPGSCQRKIPLILSGIETATFQPAAQCSIPIRRHYCVVQSVELADRGYATFRLFTMVPYASLETYTPQFDVLLSFIKPLIRSTSNFSTENTHVTAEFCHFRTKYTGWLKSPLTFLCTHTASIVQRLLRQPVYITAVKF